MRHELPEAKMLRTSDVATTWQIKWPSTIRKWGKSYYATTYPNSDSIFLETAATRRPVSSLVARKIMPQVREAIEKAGWTFGAAKPKETAFLVMRSLNVGDDVVVALYHQKPNADARADRDNQADGPGYKNVFVTEIQFEDERA